MLILATLAKAAALGWALAGEPATAAQLGKAFQAALGRDDLSALEALFHPESLTPEQSAMNKQLAANALMIETVSVTVQPLKAATTDLYTHEGVLYRLNALPNAVLELRLDKDDETPAMSFVAGTRAGVCKIVSAVPDAPPPPPKLFASKSAVKAKPPAVVALAIVRPRSKDSEAVSKVGTACAGEIGMLCNEHRENDKALLACLKENADAARSPCRTALEGL